MQLAHLFCYSLFVAYFPDKNRSLLDSSDKPARLKNSMYLSILEFLRLQPKSIINELKEFTIMVLKEFQPDAQYIDIIIFPDKLDECCKKLLSIISYYQYDEFTKNGDAILILNDWLTISIGSPNQIYRQLLQRLNTNDSTAYHSMSQFAHCFPDIFQPETELSVVTNSRELSTYWVSALQPLHAMNVVWQEFDTVKDDTDYARFIFIITKPQSDKLCRHTAMKLCESYDDAKIVCHDTCTVIDHNDLRVMIFDLPKAIMYFTARLEQVNSHEDRLVMYHYLNELEYFFPSDFAR